MAQMNCSLLQDWFFCRLQLVWFSVRQNNEKNTGGYATRFLCISSADAAPKSLACIQRERWARDWSPEITVACNHVWVECNVFLGTRRGASICTLWFQRYSNAPTPYTQQWFKSRIVVVSVNDTSRKRSGGTSALCICYRTDPKP